ncbi:MAG: glutamine--tRNA ligase/YqeY domain fusion protein [Phycisphaerales bacterium]|jgi:glutaminyl-tRNA synthetase|nr:glutamine--tRNA ligase/YqeY domain fusion protein [Phycisphaerales bacterium]
MSETPRNFIQQIIDADIASGKWGAPGDRSVVRTRFPPEPNGYLHIGHAKSINLNFGLAKEFGGKFYLRFDDTNPAKEEQEYVDSITHDVRWLGADWEGEHGAGLRYASNYFQQMYDWAEELVNKGLAYVCDLSPDEVSARRGTTTAPATSPFRDRAPDESLRLLREMRDGRHPEGSHSLRAKIDLASPNFNLRDPVMYRIVHAAHHNTGTAWHIYPMYDWAHGLEDSIEGVTHSICTLEFEDHRPLYDWFIDAINQGRTDDGSGPWGKKIHHPQQIEFAKFRPNYTVLSKRNLIRMVKDGIVRGWDDPRMPSIAGLRRRGYTPEALRDVALGVGTTKYESVIDLSRIENALRDDLNKRAPRRLAVLRPLKLTITNWHEHGDDARTEQMTLVNNPEDPAYGERSVPFSKHLFIERDDFMLDPPKKFFRLAPGAEVRLRGAYWVRCHDVVRDAEGNVSEVLCTYDPQTRGGSDPPPAPDGTKRKVKGTLHWVSAPHAIATEVRLFERLFSVESPGEATGNFVDDLNPDSLEVLTGCMLEPALAQRTHDEPAWPDEIRRFQFERLGYFCVDKDADARFGGSSSGNTLVLNRSVTLKDSFAKDVQKA